MSKFITDEIEKKVENLLEDIGYFDLEVHSNPYEKDDETVIYNYIGYSDAPMFINIYIDKDFVEVMDCYYDEVSYTQSKKLNLNNFLNNY